MQLFQSHIEDQRDPALCSAFSQSRFSGERKKKLIANIKDRADLR